MLASAAPTDMLSSMMKTISNGLKNSVSSFTNMNNEGVIPLGFVMGFFVTQIIGRWWEMFNQLSWPDKLAMNLAIYLPGGGAKKATRRYVVRLVNLASIMCLRRVSSAVARRFPMNHHLVEVGQCVNE